MSRHITRTSLQPCPTSSSRNVSTTSVTPRHLSVPPLVSFWCCFSIVPTFRLFSLWKWCKKKHLSASEGFCIHTVWSRAVFKGDSKGDLTLNHHLTSVFILCFRHPDHNYCLKGRASNMAWAAAPALQSSQLWGLQHLRGLNRICLLGFFFCVLMFYIQVDNKEHWSFS